MIPVLIILYIKKNRKQLTTHCLGLLQNKPGIFRFIVLFIACVAIGKTIIGQTKHYQYEVKKGGNSIGEINITHTVSGPVNSLLLVSDIRYRLLFLFTAKSKEEVVFTNGVMTYSSIYREQNGDKKIQAKTRKGSSTYIIERDDNKRTELNIPAIYFHTISLYITEPAAYRAVYIDKFQQLVTIQNISAHHYKVTFPDGNYNEYFYQEGVCKTIKVSQSFFNAEIELKKIF